MKTFQTISLIYWSVIQVDNTVDSKTDDLLKITWHVLGPFPCGMNEIDGIPPFLLHQDLFSHLPELRVLVLVITEECDSWINIANVR